jgi:UrcA family protein
MIQRQRKACSSGEPQSCLQRGDAGYRTALYCETNFPGGPFMNLKLSFAFIALLPALAMGAEPLETQVVGKSPTPSAVVRFGDLNLATAAGTRELQERLNVAAWQVCEQMLSRPVSIEGDKCRAQLVDAAVADINRQEHLAYGADAPLLR